MAGHRQLGLAAPGVGDGGCDRGIGRKAAVQLGLIGMVSTCYHMRATHAGGS